MPYNTYSFAGRAIIMGIVNLFLLGGNSFADGFYSGGGREDYYIEGVGQTMPASRGGLNVSLGFTLENRDPFDLATDYSESQYKMDPLGLMDLAEPSRPSTSAVVRQALKEFEILHGIKRVFDRAEAKFTNYEKRMKLKGEIVFGEKTTPRVGIGQEKNLKADAQSHGGLKSWLLRRKYMPDRISWKFGLDPSEEILTGKFSIGEYFSLQGSVGERNDALLLFQYRF